MKIQRFFKPARCCILLFAFCISSFGMASCSNSYPAEDMLLDPAIVQDIFAEYSREISYIERQHDTVIDRLTDSTLELIKQEAIENLYNDSYNFVGLMDSLALAFAGQNEQNAVSAADYLPGYHKENLSTTTYKEFGPLKGRHICDVTVGTTSAISKSISVSISSGEIIEGVQIGVSVSRTTSYSVTGPADGTMLPNSVLATHTTAMGVLYGEIIKQEYDWVSDYSPGTKIHVVDYIVEPQTSSALPHTMLTSLGVPTYVQSVRSNRVFYFSTHLEFYDTIESSPATFLLI